MLFAETRAQDQRYDVADYNYLRREALGRALGIVAATALAVLLGTAIAIAQLGPSPCWLVLGLIGVVVATRRAAEWGILPAAVVLVAGLLGVVWLSACLFPGVPVLLVALAVPIIVAVVLVGTRGGIVATLAAVGIVAAVALGQPGAVPTETLVLLLGFLSLSFWLTVALWHSFYTLLEWSWASYEEAQRSTAALRERQGELGRLNVSLEHAYERLEHVAGELERARQAAEEARRLKAEFASSVSHELRTPLNLVIGLSELMVAPPPDTPTLPDVYRADVEAIYRNAGHISNLIDDVLDLGQIDEHRMLLQREWCSLADVVAQSIATVRTLFENAGLWVEVDLPDDLPPLFVDPVRIRQILINLLNNAVRFTEEGGVTIRARASADQVVVDVVDTGYGMPPDALREVFREFWRPGTPIRGRRGSGLGLAVSKRFAELHGGNMWVASVEHQGSTFSLGLPLGKQEIVQGTELSSRVWERIAQRTAHNPLVLVADPDLEALRIFQRCLAGYDVAPTDATAVAKQAAESNVRAIVVGSGAQRDAMRRALEQAGRSVPLRVPIVVCALKTSRVLARQLGVSDYLAKPVNQSQVRRVLRRLGRTVRDVVIADDDPEMLHLLGRIVSALAPSCRPRLASDGLQALDLLRAKAPQLLLLDLLMPNLDGYGVLAQMRTDPRLAAIPVVILSSRGNEDTQIADELTISQVDGLRVGEVASWIRAGLDPARSGLGNPGWRP